MTIRILDSKTANQIAAGEVAEKPAFVIKELVENAIDAGANRIRVALKDSGLKQIQIFDNGMGMEKEDIPLAFLRHATSKITEIGDLDRLSTLGFRGEALPSIAAVSRLTLRSMAQGGDGGYEVRFDQGALGEIQPVAANPGTEVVVDELFYNTPARRKFLRSPIREMADISDLLSRLILSRPDISFELLNDNKRIYLSSGNGQVKPAVMSVYGQEAAKSLLRLGDGAHITGYISHPSYHKASRQYYNIFVNGRYIKSAELNQVIDLAYQHRMPERRYPMAILYLHLDAKDFDVNVHPNKIEIKLEPRSGIKDELLAILQETLSGAEKSYQTKGPGYLRSSEAEYQERTLMSVSLPSAIPGPNQEGESIGIEAEAVPSFFVEEEAKYPGFISEESAESISSDDRILPPTGKPLTPKSYETGEKDNMFAGEPSLSKPERINEQARLSFTEGFYRNLRVLGQLGGMFILAEDGDSLYVTDQHAAHERLLYNRFKEEIATAKEGQPLLIPLELQVNHPQYLWILQRILDLKALGFVLEDFGDNAFIIREAPSWAEYIDPVVFLRDLADFWLRQKSKITTADILDEKIIMHSCKSAVKGNQYLTDGDIRYLFQALDEGDDVFTCPHGRPITIKITVEELKKWFLRS